MATSLQKENLRIRVISPGAAVSQNDIEAAASTIRALGHKVSYGDNLFERHRYLAGALSSRLRDIESAFSDADIDAVWFARGGTGAAQLLPHIASIPVVAGRAAVGYSDNTSLLASLTERGVIAIHGPVFEEVGKTFHGTQTDERLSLRIDAHRVIEMLCQVNRSLDERSMTVSSRRAHSELELYGRTLGGNLTTLTGLVGTPWQPSFAGALLMLEDVGEPLYRIERMLVQLIQAGALNAVKAVILGDFHNCPMRGVTHSIEDIFEEHLQRLDVPIFTGGEFGHGERNRPWRIDGAALLSANRLVWNE